MTDKTRFLLGYGQKLDAVKYVGGSGESPPPYSMQEQQQRLAPQLLELDALAAELPTDAVPGGNIVAIVRLHPSALSRSAFPDLLLRHSGLRMLGSRPTRHRPEAGRGHDAPEGLPVTDLFVAGSRDDFRSTLSLLLDRQRFAPKDGLAQDFLAIEQLRLMEPADRVKEGISKKVDELEVILHYNATQDRQWRQHFTRYAKSVGVSIDAGLEFQRNDLLFMTASATREAAEHLAQFTFLRAVRPLPAPRPLEKPTVLRSTGPRTILPTAAALDPKCRMAIFDGGLPADHGFKRWARAIEPAASSGIGEAVPDYVSHGVAVTSAALFDSLTIGKPVDQPYCSVDHYRVLGTNTTGKKGLYRSLAVIDEVLTQRQYDIVSLSIGPPEPIDDDRVSAWTTLLDDHLGNTNVLGFVAVGNNGEELHPNCRVMAPSDSVNALAVGACTAPTGEWFRAPYSAIGPGRSPGLVKPDLLYFGGTDDEPFLFAAGDGHVLQECGTSFSTPALARISAGLKAHFGQQLTSTAIRAILVHSAEQAGHSRMEVGFGRAQNDIAAMTICRPGSVRVVYQGKLRPGGMIRAPITIPPGLTGDVTITATAAFSCMTDPNTPGEYTRAALEIPFRPNSTKFNIDKKTKKKPLHPATDSFFTDHDHLPEHERRLVGQKWNTVMHAEKSKRASGLHEPAFDIHYVARAPGLSVTPRDAPELNYALVVTISSKKADDLYEQVLEAFPQVLAIEPTLDISQEIQQ